MSNLIDDARGLPGVPALSTAGAWSTVFEGAAREELEAALPGFVLARRWFGSKARALRTIRLVEVIPILPSACLTLLRVAYAEGDGETYILPVGFATGEAAQTLRRERPFAIIAALHAGQEHGILYDAVWDARFLDALLDTIRAGGQHAGTNGDLVSYATAALPRLCGDASEPLHPVLLGAEQSNNSVRYGDRLMLKLYRRLEPGINPDQEIGRFLTEQAGFDHVPPLAGALEYHPRGADAGEPMTVALLQGFVPNRGDAWSYTLAALADYFAAAREQGPEAARSLPLPRAPLLELVQGHLPPEAQQHIGAYLDAARLLARRTAELHRALSSDGTDPAFAPEPFSPEFQDYLHRSMRSLTDRIMRLLAARFDGLSARDRREAEKALALEGQIAARFDGLLARPIHVRRSRIHGDYHLGQALYTGDDFMIIDFEGEPARALSERRMKRSPLQDVAGMLRSFHYAAYAAYFEQDGAAPAELETWARFWRLWVSVAFLQTYLAVAGRAPFLPASADELALLLDVHLVEKAVYELGYELNNRPGWARIPLQGILQTVAGGA